MKKMSKPIIFFGSGPVAAKSLRLLAEYLEVEAVITKPRAAHHKGDVPVLSTASTLGIPVHTTTDKRSLDDLFTSLKLESSVGILIDFGIIISQKVIDYFPLGIINSHFSLLPEWRGADPITFAVLSGQKTTGVSLMLLVAGMDEGPLLAQAEHTIKANDTTDTLTNDLILLSDALLEAIVPLYIAQTIMPIDQMMGSIHPLPQPTYSRKVIKEDGLLNWEKPAHILEREVRAFSGWPKSRTVFSGLDIVIIKAHVLNANGLPGKTIVVGKTPVVYCGNGALVLDIVKPAGKKEMTGEAFLAGYKNVFLGFS